MCYKQIKLVCNKPSFLSNLFSSATVLLNIVFKIFLFKYPHKYSYYYYFKLEQIKQRKCKEKES